MCKIILLKLLKFFSKKIIKKYHPRVVGITGSIGKSSAKEAIAAVLSVKFRLRENYKNYNNEIGVPLTIIGVKATPARSILSWLIVFFKASGLLLKKDSFYPEMLILEMGSDKPGDISYLTDIAPPEIGVLTHISGVHMEAFSSLEKIALEKKVIVADLPVGGFALLNFDNELVVRYGKKTRAKIITYGFGIGADFQASDVTMVTSAETGWPTGINFKVIHNGSIVPVFLPGQIAEHLIYAALSGVALGFVFGMNLVESASAVKSMKLLPGHMRLIPGIKETMIIDDTYNSSPDAVKSALLTLNRIAIRVGSRKYAVLGDMLGLGDRTADLHREVGFKVAELGMDFLITIGEAGKHIAAGAKEAGLSENQVASFESSASAGRFLQEKLKRGDLVLVKASQGIRAEKVVLEIMAEPLEARELLARQGNEWQGV